MFSSRVNHALAYAALHHAGQSRKGTRVPYITHIANVAIILARYGCDEFTITAGILHDVVEDCDRPGCSPDSHRRQISDKFGDDVLAAVLTVTKPVDDDAHALTWAERAARYLEQIRRGPESALWVCAADKLHNVHCILSDLERAPHPQDVWSRFNAAPAQSIGYYRAVHDVLAERGLDRRILDDLGAAVAQLERSVTQPT